MRGLLPALAWPVAQSMRVLGFVLVFAYPAISLWASILNPALTRTQVLLVVWPWLVFIPAALALFFGSFYVESKMKG
jgi:hypothetical protein